MTKVSSMPEPIGRWLVDALGDEPHSENKADCGACVMCSPTDWTTKLDKHRFDPAVRCCSYTPTLWNFQVGAVLSQSDRVHPVGVATVSARIRTSPGAGPLGILATDREQRRYDQMSAKGEFGKDKRLRCAHLVGGDQCGVHTFRNAVCSTWYCRHERGKAGKGYWSAIRNLLNAMENTAANNAAHVLLPGGADAWDEVSDPEGYYMACWELVRGWDWEDLKAMGGEELRKAHFVGAAAEGAMNRPRKLPEAPSFNEELTLLGEVDDHVLVHAFSRYDPYHVPDKDWPRLARFDGRPLETVRAELAAEGTTLTDDQILDMIDYDVLQ